MINNKASLKDHFSILRLDHATKHIFMLPGIIIACLLVAPDRQRWGGVALILGFLCAVCIASANYTINEYLDREFDKHHPLKSQRAAVQKKFSPLLIFLQWLILTLIGFSSAFSDGPVMLGGAILFSLQGIIYNIRPVRSKERAFLDIISESINNPIRLVLGWAIIAPYSIPPLLLISAYWLGGSFLMSAKRLSEYREISASHGKDVLIHYRKSFSYYTETSLMGCCLSYAILSNTLCIFFLTEWRIEYILVAPALCALFVTYYLMSTHPKSIAQRPEDLFKEPKLMLILLLLIISCTLANYAHIPNIRELLGTNPIYLN